MKVKYVGPFDEVEIPTLGAAVKREAELDDVPPAVAAGLLEQPDNFEPADDEASALLARLEADRESDEDTDANVPADELDALTVAQLKEQAEVEENGPVDIAGLTTKADLIAAIRAHRNPEGA